MKTFRSSYRRFRHFFFSIFAHRGIFWEFCFDAINLFHGSWKHFMTTFRAVMPMNFHHTLKKISHLCRNNEKKREKKMLKCIKIHWILIWWWKVCARHERKLMSFSVFDFNHYYFQFFSFSFCLFLLYFVCFYLLWTFASTWNSILDN